MKRRIWTVALAVASVQMRRFMRFLLCFKCWYLCVRRAWRRRVANLERASVEGLFGKWSRWMARETCREARTQGVPICGHIGATEDAASWCVARVRRS